MRPIRRSTWPSFPLKTVKWRCWSPTHADGPVAKYIDVLGEGVQHIAFRVENIEEALAELKANGVRLIDQEPRKGAGGAKIAFVHPKETNGVLVEIRERN
jgi:methylmalonyl-CoA/ethylmalonyl-CoA epimerase